MINAIIRSISRAINAEFGDRYENHMEAIRQDLKEPCFFIQCPNQTSALFVGKRYVRQNQFCIQYFPETEQVQQECNAVGERLLSCMECIRVDNRILRGTKMKYRVTDDVLHFFVDYDFFARRVEEEIPMDGMESETAVKG